MRAMRLGGLAAVIVAAVLALLWITEAVPRSDVADMAPKALGAIAVIMVAGVVVTAIRGGTGSADGTDKPVP